MSTLITSITVLEVPAGAITSPPKKEEKVSELKRKRLKLSLFVDAIILYIKKSKNSTKKTDLINEFTKIADKINIQKPTVFLYTNKKFSEIITKISKKKNYLGINLRR